MNCRTCSNPLPEEAVFCPECGVRVAAREVMSRESAVVGAAGGHPAVAESLGVSRQKADRDGALARPKAPPSSAQPPVLQRVQTSGRFGLRESLCPRSRSLR